MELISIRKQYLKAYEMQTIIKTHLLNQQLMEKKQLWNEQKTIYRLHKYWKHFFRMNTFFSHHIFMNQAWNSMSFDKIPYIFEALFSLVPFRLNIILLFNWLNSANPINFCHFIETLLFLKLIHDYFIWLVLESLPRLGGKITRRAHIKNIVEIDEYFQHIFISSAFQK